MRKDVGGSLESGIKVWRMMDQLVRSFSSQDQHYRIRDISICHDKYLVVNHSPLQP